MKARPVYNDHIGDGISVIAWSDGEIEVIKERRGANIHDAALSLDRELAVAISKSLSEAADELQSEEAENA